MANGVQGRYAAIAVAVIVGAGAAYFVASTPGRRQLEPIRSSAPIPQPGLVMATCTGGLDETPDLEFSIPLDNCDATIDTIDVKSGFLSKLTICSGAKSFEIVLNPRAVRVTSDALHCSTERSEVSVTFIGTAKK